MKSIVHRALTRPIHNVETKRSYAIREKIFSLDPYLGGKHPNAKPEVMVVIQTISRSAADAAWAARSLLLALPFRASVTFALDGPFEEARRHQLQGAFPAAHFISTDDILPHFRECAPHLWNLARVNPLGRKLLTILHLQKGNTVLYSDSDVLCFDRIPEIERCISQGESGRYIQEASGFLHADPGTLMAASEELSLPYAGTLNSGFLCIRQGALDMAYAEEILAQNQSDYSSWFIEQTLMSVLMQAANALPLPCERYVVSTQRQFYFQEDVDYSQVSVRHFVSTVRHLMYLKGMPRLWSQWQRQEGAQRA